jgi:hypothetical protein
MKLTLRQFITKINSLNYGKNTLTSVGHENNLEKLFIDLGLQKLEKLKSKTKTKLTNFSFIKHPNGTQKTPDFKVNINNKIINIECKSCQSQYKPMWNASYPSEDTIYIYTNKKDNKTIIFLGTEIVQSKVKKIFEEYKLLNKKLHNEINEKLNYLTNDENPYGMNVYARNMFVQTKNLNNRSIDIEQLLEKVILKIS